MIDRYFVITLDTAAERQNNFAERFGCLITSDRFEWYVTARDSENTERGCYNSHRNILLAAKARGYRTIVVLEDDADPLIPCRDFLERADTLPSQLPPEWRVLLLGYFPVETARTFNPNLYSIKCSVGSHGYIANVERLEIPPYNGTPIDAEMMCHGGYESMFASNAPMSGVYGVYPMLLRQSSSHSTISSSHAIAGSLDYDRDAMVKMSSDGNVILIALFSAILLLVVTGTLLRRFLLRRRP